MNASIGTQAQNRNATTRRRPLSLRHSSVEGELDFGILRQPQNRQPTHMPNTHEAEVRYPDLSNVSNGPGPELPGELQQATPPVPAPVQSGSAAASQQQQEQHPAEMRVATARDLGRRTRPTQRQPHHPRPNNTYLPEPHYIENPPADERGIASYIPNPMPWILAIFNTVGNWICTAFTSVKDVVRWIFHVLWASLMFLTTIVEWIKALWRAFRSLMVILAILACCALCLFVFKSVCSGVNKFCEFEFNPLRPIICPVEMCMKDPYPNLNGTVAAPSAPVVGVFVPEDDRNAKSKDTEYIRSLFRIPHALEGASIMYVC